MPSVPQSEGHFANEIVPVRAASHAISVDEEPQRFDESKLRDLKPAFGRRWHRDRR